MNRKVGTVLAFFTIFLEIITAIVLTPLIIKTFGQAQYGVYTLVLSISSYLALLDLGIGNSVVKYMSKYRANGDFGSQKKFLGVITLYYLIICLTIIVIGGLIYALFPYLFSRGLTGEEITLSKRLLIVSTLNIAFVIGTSGFLYTVVAYENFYVSKGLPAFFSIIRIVVTFVCLKNNCSCFEVLMIQFLCNVSNRMFVVLFVLFGMKIIPTLKNVDKRFMRPILSYSLLIMLQMIAAQINSATDQILIGVLVSSSSVILGIYGVGAQVNHYYQTFGGALNSVIMPGIVKKVENNPSAESIQDEMTKIGRLNLIIVGIIYAVFLVYGKQFIVLWSGEENQKAYYIAAILMAPYSVILSQDVGLKFLWALDKQKFLSIIKLSIVVVNICFTIVLIKWNPLLGATIGTFISLFLGDVILLQVAFKKELKIKLLRYYEDMLKGILLSLLLSLLIGFLFSLLKLNGIKGFIINCSVMVLVYCLCLLIFGLNQYEKATLKKLALKIIKRGK